MSKYRLEIYAALIAISYIIIFIATLVILTKTFAVTSLTIGPPIATTEALVPQYNKSVYKMSDAEFFQWATVKNRKAKAAWNKWYTTAKPPWVTSGVTIKRKQGSIRVYRPRYLNPKYKSRPLTIINPYCKPKQH